MAEPSSKLASLLLKHKKTVVARLEEFVTMRGEIHTLFGLVIGLSSFGSFTAVLLHGVIDGREEIWLRMISPTL